MPYGDLESFIEKKTPDRLERLYLGNVLVNSQRRALLADFGLSRALDAGPSGFTTGNDGRGTVRFSSPEILLEGVEGQSLASDIWSWGCLVLEVMTDKIPFPNIRLEPQLIAALMKGRTPCDAETLARDLPQFSDLIVKCWNGEPNLRPKADYCLTCVQIEAFSSPPRQPGARMEFREFFTEAYNRWLTQRQLTLDPPRVDGKVVELHKLFLMVGAFGGCRAVFEKKMWPVVGAKIGFPYFNGPLPYSKPEVAEQLSKIYQKILGDFELHWHNSLRAGDPNSTFPLPPQLQYLHPEINRLVAFLFPLRQLPQPQHPLGAGPPQQPDIGDRGPILNEMPQQTPQMGQPQAQQEATMRNQVGVAFPPQAGPSSQAAPMVAASLANLPPQVQQFLTSPEALKLSPEELKRRGISQEMIIQSMMIYRNQSIAKTLQGRKEQELQQQTQLQAQQQENFPNSQSQTLQLVPGNRPASGLGGGLGGAGGNTLQPSALPQSGGPQVPATVPLLPGLNIPPEQFVKAQEKVRAAIGLFFNKRDYTSINLSHDQGILLEQSIAQTQSLLKQVAQNLVSFVLLAPNDERELNQVAQTVVTLSDQARILEKQPPEKRFIFDLKDLNNYRHHLTTFLMRVKGLQNQAVILQNQPDSVALPSVPFQVTQQEPPAPLPQPPDQMRPLTAEPIRPPIPAQSGGAPHKPKPTPKAKLPPRLEKTRPTPEIPPTDGLGTTQLEAERSSLKRGREDDIPRPSGSTGSSGLPKRARRDFGRTHSLGDLGHKRGEGNLAIYGYGGQP
ncbi:hypothetical protein FRC01_001081 [Tulasnella sp. 417]|nr:hypothetical protein FRC01_001081 [Tulasnella sp. 417]